MMTPEIESIKLCAASEMMASEPERTPTIILKIAKRKLINIKR